ncbi:MAG: hypothetical protein AB4041_17330 [Microcystaceae cyanobacterium]
MNRNEFEELEALERPLQEVERQLLELREDKKKLEDRQNQLRIGLCFNICYSLLNFCFFTF